MFPVMEHFYTIQGEGFHQGRAAYFIRLAGCDVGCVWCDVKESWTEDGAERLSIDRLKLFVKEAGANLVVVTGGEPLMHNLDELTHELQSEGIEVNIETSGAYPLSGKWNWICVSPKKFKAPLPEMLLAANELKVVVFNKSDFDWAEKNAASTSSKCKLYLQPEWSKSSMIMPEIVEYIKLHPKWELSLQIHKFIQVP